MEEQEDISQELREYFINKYGVCTDKIKADASLLYDFKMPGDDVDDFFSN